MGKKAAVLVGCNYPGTKAELKGCVNDVHRMRRSLVDRFGFAEADISVLIDTDESYIQPTGANVRRAINRLIRAARPGDDLFVHYSGHGARLPADPDDYDNTGFHECIVPCDMNLLTDEDFREFVDKLPENCRLTVVADSCNSGGLIENAKEQIGDSTRREVSSAAGTENNNRSLPISTVIDILQERTGRDDIHVGNLRSSAVFAENGGDEEGKKRVGDSGRGILISGCQSDQNAADAKPVMRAEGAFGALSNAIQAILSQREGSISNRELVLTARKMMSEQGFAQRPGLYCGDAAADEPFVC